MPKKPDSDIGLATGVKYWLFFMLSLAVLGYTPFLSITFGALGGIASGVIAAWLKPKEEYEPSKAERQEKEREVVKEEAIEPTRRVRFRRYGLPTVRRHHPTQGNRRFSWLFRRRS